MKIQKPEIKVSMPKIKVVSTTSLQWNRTAPMNR